MNVRLWTKWLGFESSYSHVNFRFCACFELGVPWHSGNYRKWIHSETRTWHDKNIQLNAPYRWVLTTQLNHLANLAKRLSVRLWAKWLWTRIQLQSLTWFLFNDFIYSLFFYVWSWWISNKSRLRSRSDFHYVYIMLFEKFQQAIYRFWLNHLLNVKFVFFIFNYYFFVFISIYTDIGIFIVALLV